jgi:very-long-chain (3R)-3-hydroxyacyl-CoA dehydratase
MAGKGGSSGKPKRKPKDRSAPIKAYLATYNAACMVGWFMVLFKAVQYVYVNVDATKGEPLEVATAVLAGVFPAVKNLLTYVQLAAICEVFHARELLGFVKSDLFSALMQVTSRVVVLIMCLASPSSANAWHGGTMVFAWCSIEVPRYAFYLISLVKDPAEGVRAVPYALYWYRYSAFFILYPVGITSELLCEWMAYQNHGAELAAYTGLAPVGAMLAPYLRNALLGVFAVYIPGAPFLFLHMMKQRAKSLKNYANASKSTSSAEETRLTNEVERLTKLSARLKKENKKLKKN